MNSILARSVGFVLTRSRLALLPVRVRSGIAAGARWTLFPWTSYWRGTHEPALQRAMLELGGGNIRGWSCWDLGAHFGLYSVGLAQRVGPEGEVAAFEPNPRSFARLARHRDLNGLTWLKLYRAAVSDHNDGAELYTYGELGTTTTHLPYEGEDRTANVGALAVQTLRLDDLVARGELRAPQFVKVDVEGHGHRAIAGMARTLAAARPIAIVAFHSPAEIAGILSVLQPLGYTWRDIAGGPDCPDPAVGDYVFTPAGFSGGERSRSR